MASVLLVEDSPLVIKIVKYLLANELGIEPIVASTLQDTKKIVESGETILAAVVDLNLPDAPKGEALDYLLAKDVPSIVLTGDFDEERRKSMLQKPIVDYIVKESRYSYEYVARLIRRLQHNQRIKVLVVDDAASSRAFIKQLLVSHLFQVLEAENGQQAYDTLQQNKDVKLLITDFGMPVMDGFALTSKLRREPEFAQLVIIGLSAADDVGLSAKFIKAGANDFLAKPFGHEEFYCRIIHNVETVELLEHLKDANNRDYLTGLYNRRFFFDTGQQLLNKAAADARPAMVVEVDVDYLKSVNEGHGQAVGDEVLRDLAAMLKRSFGSHMVARLGEDTFGLLLYGVDEMEAEEMLERFRAIIENHDIAMGDVRLSYTLSMGYNSHMEDTLEAMLSVAERYLVQAKEDGRNQIQGR